MRDGHKKQGGKLARGASEQAAGRAIDDPQTARLLRMGRAIGNDEIQRRLSQGNATRDELLDFLCRRLNVMREAQLRELGFQDHQREHWRDIADSHKSGFTKPDPTRFHEAARTYEEAAYQLCRGALGRGSQLLDRALSQEQKAFEALPTRVVDTKELELAAERPRALEELSDNQGCGERPVPADVDLAREIQNVTTRFSDPPVKKRAPDPWWTEEEDEEEEAGGDAGGA